MSLVLRRLDGETWRECALRYAAKAGLEGEVEDIYEDTLEHDWPVGDPGQAAWGACYEWDILDYEP